MCTCLHEILDFVMSRQHQFTAVWQHKDLAVELMTTQEKTIVMIDNDTWAGMNAASGVPVGKNNVGKALMHVRTEMMQQK